MTPRRKLSPLRVKYIIKASVIKRRILGKVSLYTLLK